MFNKLFIQSTAICLIIIFNIFTLSSDLSADTYTPLLSKAFKALDNYVKTADSWDRVHFQNCLTEAAESGDPEAQYQYYHFSFDKHYKGYYWPDIMLSDSMAVEYLKKSSSKGNLNALGEIGLLMINGKKEWKIEENKLKAFEYLNVARKTDNPKYIKALGNMYLERADTIHSSYQEALNCYNQLENIGGNKWDVFQGKFEVYFRMNEFRKAYPFAKQWLVEYKKQLKYENELNYKKIDPKFVYPTYKDCINALEVFISEEKISDLNYIPIFSESFNIYYPENELNFKNWNDDNIYHKNKMLDMIEDYYLHKNVDPNYLKGIKSLKFFYNLDKSPDKYHCFSRARYYKYIQDYDNEIRLLYEGVNKSDFSSILQLALYYFYGTENISIDKNRSFELLKDVKDKSLYIGYNRLDYAKACFLLGMMYYSKDIKGFDYKKSVEYLNEFLKIGKGSSKKVIGEVYSMLSKCYRYGRGVEVDISKADKYSSLALNYGNAEETEIQKWLNSISTDDSSEKSIF